MLVFATAVRTIYDAFWKGGYALNPDGPCLGTRDEIPVVQNGKVEKTWGEYRFMSYKQVGERIKDFGSGIVSLYEQVRLFAGRRRCSVRTSS